MNKFATVLRLRIVRDASCIRSFGLGRTYYYPHPPLTPPSPCLAERQAMAAGRAGKISEKRVIGRRKRRPITRFSVNHLPPEAAGGGRGNEGVGKSAAKHIKYRVFYVFRKSLSLLFYMEIDTRSSGISAPRWFFSRPCIDHGPVQVISTGST